MQQSTAALLSATQHMIHQVLAQGQAPVAFHINRKGIDMAAQDIANDYWRSLSVFKRAWITLRGKKSPPKLDALHGVPVTEDPNVADGAVFLQTKPMQIPTMQRVAQPSGDVPREFVERQPVHAETQESDEMRPTLDDLVGSKGDRVSCTDILVKAMEEVDALKGIIVVRIHRNGDVDMTANLNKFEMQGALQHAQMWLMQRGD